MLTPRENHGGVSETKNPHWETRVFSTGRRRGKSRTPDDLEGAYTFRGLNIFISLGTGLPDGGLLARKKDGGINRGGGQVEGVAFQENAERGCIRIGKTLKKKGIKNLERSQGGK